MNELDEPSSATAAPFEVAETESREAAGGIEAYRFPVFRVVHFNGLVGGVPYQRRPADGDAMVDIDVGHGHEGRDIEQFPALRIFIKLKDVEIGVDEFVAEVECPEVGVDFPFLVPPDIAGGQIARAVHADQGRGLVAGKALLFDVFPGFLVVGKAIHGLSARPVGDTAGSPVETAHPAHDDILAFGSAVTELHETRGDDTPVDGGVVTEGFFEVFAFFKRLVQIVVVLGNEFALDSESFGCRIVEQIGALVGDTDSKVAEDFEESPGGALVESLTDDLLALQGVGADTLQQLDAGGVDGDGGDDDGVLSPGLLAAAHHRVVPQLDKGVPGYGDIRAGIGIRLGEVDVVVADPDHLAPVVAGL